MLTYLLTYVLADLLPTDAQVDDQRRYSALVQSCEQLRTMHSRTVQASRKHKEELHLKLQEVAVKGRAERDAIVESVHKGLLQLKADEKFFDETKKSCSATIALTASPTFIPTNLPTATLGSPSRSACHGHPFFANKGVRRPRFPE